MEFKERINQLAYALGMNKTQLQEKAGLSNSYFANVNKVSGKVAAKIKQLYPQVNIDWLNDGVGSMFIERLSATEGDTVPLLPISATGSLSAFEAKSYGYECERIVSPMKGISLALTISGDSMSPEYPSGSKIFIKKINENVFVEWGHTYVLDTRNGFVVRNVYLCPDNAEEVVCRSVNSDYPEFNIRKSDIIGWYRVMMQVIVK